MRLFVSTFFYFVLSYAVAQSTFNPDSAYHFIEQQLNFGPRVPGTAGHKACADFFIQKLESYGGKVETQKFTAALYDHTTLNLTNIIATFNPEVKPRILLAAHWDTRPIADKDSTHQNEPIPGANDGASGPGVLLEVARQISQLSAQDLRYGVDIILFDGEDQGEPLGFKLERTIENAGKIWWCLGSQYWVQNLHQPDYDAEMGILLDMVGAPEATFYKEGGSMQFASRQVNRVWRVARKAGFSDFFINEKVAGLMDDHIFVSKDAGIPMLDIIHMELSNKDNFPDYHHTHLDNLNQISKESLNAVGSTLMLLLRKE